MAVCVVTRDTRTLTHVVESSGQCLQPQSTRDTAPWAVSPCRGVWGALTMEDLGASQWQGFGKGRGGTGLLSRGLGSKKVRTLPG